MKDEVWSCHIEPPPQGWARLAARLHRAEEEHATEIRFWRRLSFAAVALALVVYAIDFRGAGETLTLDLPTGVVSDRGPAVQVPGTSPGVHVYWVMSGS